MTVFLATILSFCVVSLMQDDGTLTRRKTKQAFALVLVVVSAALFGVAFGVMRGTFIFIGVLSLFGTLFTLLRHKLIKV